MRCFCTLRVILKGASSAALSDLSRRPAARSTALELSCNRAACGPSTSTHGDPLSAARSRYRSCIQCRCSSNSLTPSCLHGTSSPQTK